MRDPAKFLRQAVKFLRTLDPQTRADVLRMMPDDDGIVKRAIHREAAKELALESRLAQATTPVVRRSVSVQKPTKPPARPSTPRRPFIPDAMDRQAPIGPNWKSIRAARKRAQAVIAQPLVQRRQEFHDPNLPAGIEAFDDGGVTKYRIGQTVFNSLAGAQAWLFGTSSRWQMPRQLR